MKMRIRYYTRFFVQRPYCYMNFTKKKGSGRNISMIPQRLATYQCQNEYQRPLNDTSIGKTSFRASPCLYLYVRRTIYTSLEDVLGGFLRIITWEHGLQLLVIILNVYYILCGNTNKKTNHLCSTYITWCVLCMSRALASYGRNVMVYLQLCVYVSYLDA